MTERWRALESNPDVLTGFIRKVGVSSDYQFHDVFGLDEELLMMIPQPAHAVILLFPGAERDKQANDAAAADTSGPFFLYQVKGLGNACGTIAAIHSVANSEARASLAPSSPLDAYLKACQEVGPEQRGQRLLGDDEIQKAHDAQASEGQTSSEGADGEVDYHFVSFVHSNGSLFELDGLRAAPIARGTTTADNLLKDAAKVIQEQHIAKKPDMVSFAVLSLGPSEG
mmetsp:Transcript_87/g.268  ORF Transcript_87/g.268 Transcript_87/m.268 type:complete len:227 (-) Transcript_87:206-886(-)|eukprot:CAMPEP_0173440258 /NCGR_PEP_ID=MMETSP1357-20121228/22506_1 /TAXON_ID=77926 /ORGANISM="Hemiselmis rufescens, Strain PCC563" /LENGTH=226 /DNA_ID=CAMNT_0014405721 /DNA_START=48 /DNA_END=728 /DNA_ORIENTATION=+